MARDASSRAAFDFRCERRVTAIELMTTPLTMKTIAPPTAHTLLLLLLVLSGLDQTLLSASLPTIVRELGGADRAPWVFSAFLIASTVVIPLYGKLADRFGVRPMLLTSTGLFIAGSLACGAAWTMDALIAARVLQGLGGGGLTTMTMLATTAAAGHSSYLAGRAAGSSPSSAGSPRPLSLTRISMPARWQRAPPPRCCRGRPWAPARA